RCPRGDPALPQNPPHQENHLQPGIPSPSPHRHHRGALGDPATRIPAPPSSVGLPRLQLPRLLLERIMPAASRTYWLTTACRIRRHDQSLVIDRESGDKVHIPITDVRDIVACAPVDVNFAVISLLNRYKI